MKKETEEREKQVDTSKLDNAVKLIQEKLSQMGVDFKDKTIVIKDNKVSIK